MGELDLRQTLHETVTLEFGHDDLPWGRSEYKVPSKASYAGFGTRLVVER